MEARVWGEPEVLPYLKEKFVVISLYADDKTIVLPRNQWYTSKSTGREITRLDKKNLDIQRCFFNENSQPQYVMLDNRAEMLGPSRAYDLEVEAFVRWLDEGYKLYEKRMVKEQRN